MFRLHGGPQFLVSERFNLFTSTFFAKVSGLLGLKQHLLSAYHPQTDGRTERANRNFEDMLRHFINPAQNDWDIRLPYCEFAVNNAWNRATRSTLFLLNCGSHPRTPVIMDVVTPLPTANAFAGRVREAVVCARASLLNAEAHECVCCRTHF